MIQSIKSAELDKFSDLLTDHLNEVTTEMKVCTDAKVNKLLRGEVSNITSMINAIGKHKLFATSYQELTESSDDEPLPLPKRAPQERIKLAQVEREPVIIAKHATKKPRSTKSIRDTLLSVK
jgi:hypothetical protein